MKRKILMISVVILMLALMGIAVLYWCSQPPGVGKECIFTVEKGWGASRISQVLADSGLVRCRLYLLWRYSRMDDLLPLQAGIYCFDDSMSPDSILGIMTRGDVLPVQTSWVTISPGLTLAQSLGLISEATGIPEIVLDSLSTDSVFLASNSVPVLEGYLFPETYKFSPGSSPKDIIKIMVAEFFKKIKNINFSKSNFSLHQTLTLASIVEKETGAAFERDIIAGVFLNRLKKRIRLHSDPTIIYGFYEKFKGSLRKKDIMRKRYSISIARIIIAPIKAVPAIADLSIFFLRYA